MSAQTQTPHADAALDLLGPLMRANAMGAALTQQRVAEDLSSLMRLVLHLREAELFRDEAVRFASAEVIATERRAQMYVVDATVVHLPTAARRPMPFPHGGNAA